jgi:nicotinamide-nucleotide amidase
MDAKLFRFVKLVLKKKIKLAFAESVTCGMIADKLCTIKGTSEFFMGSVVCYHPDVKTGLLAVPAKLIKKHSPESAEVTKALAGNLRKLIKADMYGAITGVAVGNQETKHSTGTIFLCVYDGKKFYQEKKVFRGSPLTIRKKACFAMFDLMAKQLK